MATEVKVPDVGESVTEVYIGEWYKSEGDQVAQDDDLVELESDKATFDAPAPATGVLKRILKQSGDTAEVGEVIAYIEDSNDDSAKQDKQEASERKEAHKEGKKAKSDRKKQEAADKRKPSKKKQRRRGETARARGSDANEDADEDAEKPARQTESESRVMPAARRLLDEHELSVEDVPASGPGGRLLKEDVLHFVERQQQQADVEEADDSVAQQQFDGDVEIVPMSPIRRRIAKRLVEAQQRSAILTTFNEIDMSAVILLRKQFQDAFVEKYGVKLGLMSFFVKASVDALQQLPELNAAVRGTNIAYHNRIDMGIAIGTEKGLVVPVLRDAARMSFAEIEVAVGQFARKARDGNLTVDDLQGGTFTISNGGIYGSLLSTPIVNPPQSGVLGMHAFQDRPVVRDGEIVVRPMMYVALSYDHRIVDGREAVTFLRRIKETIEEPSRMLLEV